VPGDLIAIGLYLVVLSLLLLQPDVGMAVVVSAIWFAQYFLAGLRILWVVMLGGTGRRSSRRRLFRLPARREPHQPLPRSAVGRHLSGHALARGLHQWRAAGRGPGEGTVKTHLPDAHSDFVFAVAGEEFG
jgi:cell division protein FtsW